VHTHKTHLEISTRNIEVKTVAYPMRQISLIQLYK